MKHDNNHQVRWAAVGAAVAVALGAGGIGISHATLSSGERTAFVPINPCRLADTRPGVHNVGVPAAPVGTDREITLTAHGTQGNCTITAEATALALNVTAVNQTEPTYLTVYPAGAERPLASNVNPFPGEPPTPNAVTVDIDDDGRFSIYNRFGTVDVVVDVVGYYEDHNHDDRYPLRSEVPTRLVVPFELEPGATSDPIELPVDVPVSLIAASLTPGDVGVANASLLASTGVADPGDEYVSWVSTSAGNMPAISGGRSDNPGQPVVMIDEGGTVEVQLASTTAIQVANLSAAAATGTLTLTW